MRLAEPITLTGTSPAERIIGEETFADAWAAVQRVLDDRPELRVPIESVLIESAADRIRPMRFCPECELGRLHALGQQRMSGGRASRGTLVLCDGCAYFGSRR